MERSNPISACTYTHLVSFQTLQFHYYMAHGWPLAHCMDPGGDHAVAISTALQIELGL